MSENKRKELIQKVSNLLMDNLLNEGYLEKVREYIEEGLNNEPNEILLSYFN